MDEFIPASPNDTETAPTAYTPEALRAVIDNEKWRSLGPNLYSPGHDLLPQELSADQVDTLVATILKEINFTDTYVEKNAEQIAEEVSREPINLGEIGVLTFVGGGEAKICYCLERDGRKMALLFQGYKSDIGIQIPDDPHLTKVNEVPAQRVWEYSDLRTYAMLPLAHDRAIKLQEFGEPPNNSYMSVLNSLTGVIARRAATSYIAQHLPNTQLGPGTNTSNELRQPDHLLNKPGHKRSVIIDVPVVERLRRN